ncbi:MAG: DDE-type integrase/transposase/recombinase [Patescibacteria group bacterium]
MKRLTNKKESKSVFLYFDFLINGFITFGLFKAFIDDLILAYRKSIQSRITFFCPRCRFKHYWKNGVEERMFGPPVQKFICPYCGKQFCENTFSPFYYFKYPTYIILACLKFKGDGKPVGKIRALSMLIYVIGGVLSFFTPCYQTIARWIKKFGQKVIAGTHKFKLKAKKWKPWQMDEMYSSRILPAPKGKYVRKGKKKVGRVGVKDPVTQLCFMESTFEQDNKTLNSIFERAKTRFGQTPRTMTTDGHLGYEPVFENKSTKHKVVIHNREYKNKQGYHTNNIENHWTQIRTVERPARGYKKFETHSFYTKFHEAIYNFLRSNQRINGLTPAQKAGVKEQISLLSLII